MLPLTLIGAGTEDLRLQFIKVLRFRVRVKVRVEGMVAVTVSHQRLHSDNFGEAFCQVTCEGLHLWLVFGSVLGLPFELRFNLRLIPATGVAHCQ